MPSSQPPTDHQGGERGASDQTAQVFLAAGEASGDWAGGLLARELRALRNDLALAGIGGRQMAAAGVDLLADSSTWGAIGVFEAATKVPRVWRALRAARAHLAQAPPSALVLIDFGAGNMLLARAARRMGLPTLYYFPPGSWRQRAGNVEVRDLVDAIATPFPWSRDLLQGGRARVEWVGHPVVETARPRITREEAWARYRLDAVRPVVALAPGSRQQEMHYVLPVMAEAARRLAGQLPDLQLLVPVAASLAREHVMAVLHRAGVEAVLLEGMDYDALQLAEAAMVCSGTVTLEFACLGVPMVVVYRASRATTLQYRLIRGLLGGQRFAAMPNIIAGREVVRELLGSAATPEAIAQEVASLLSDQGRRARLRSDLGLVVACLGPAGATRRTAEMVLGLVNGKEASREPGG